MVVRRESGVAGADSVSFDLNVRSSNFIETENWNYKLLYDIPEFV